MKAVERILVIRSGALGDSVVTLPAIGALRRKWPSSHIEVIGSPSLIELVRGRYYADRVVRIDESGFANFFTRSGVLPDIWTNYLKNFDLVVCFIRDDCLLENIKKAGAENVISMPSRDENRVHMVDRLLKVLEPLEIAGDTVPRIFFTSGDRLFASRFWERHELLSSIVIAIHPGSGSKRKNWPVERFREVARSLLSTHRAKILVPCGEADEEVSKEMVEGFLSSDMIVVRDCSLTELGAVFEKCECFIGNDSGLSHLAAASGTSTICIFGPTDHRVWSPKGKVIIVRKEVPCSPCSREEMLSCESQMCLDGIKSEEVVERIGCVPILDFVLAQRVPKEHSDG